MDSMFTSNIDDSKEHFVVSDCPSVINLPAFTLVASQFMELHNAEGDGRKIQLTDNVNASHQALTQLAYSLNLG